MVHNEVHLVNDYTVRALIGGGKAKKKQHRLWKETHAHNFFSLLRRCNK